MAAPNHKIHSTSVTLPSLGCCYPFVPEQMGEAVSELSTPSLPAPVLLWVPGKDSGLANHYSVYLILFSPLSLI